MTTIDAPHGIILWAGNGSEVQRMDFPEDAEGNFTEPVFEGDMDAALYLAEHTEARWLVYYDVVSRDKPESPTYNPWAVHAFTTREEAVDHGLHGAAPGAFCWDGRKGAPPEHWRKPSNGFSIHPEAEAWVGSKGQVITR